MGRRCRAALRGAYVAVHLVDPGSAKVEIVDAATAGTAGVDRNLHNGGVSTTTVARTCSGQTEAPRPTAPPAEDIAIYETVTKTPARHNPPQRSMSKRYKFWGGPSVELLPKFPELKKVYDKICAKKNKYFVARPCHGPVRMIEYDFDNQRILLAAFIKKDDTELIADPCGQWFNVKTESLHADPLPGRCTVTYRPYDISSKTKGKGFRCPASGLNVTLMMNHCVIKWLKSAANCTKEEAVRLACASGIFVIAKVADDEFVYSYAISPEGHGFFLPLHWRVGQEENDRVAYNQPPPSTNLRFEGCSIWVLPMTHGILFHEMTQNARHFFKTHMKGRPVEQKSKQNVSKAVVTHSQTAPPSSLENFMKCAFVSDSVTHGSIFYLYGGEMWETVAHIANGIPRIKDAYGFWWDSHFKGLTSKPPLGEGSVFPLKVDSFEFYALCKPRKKYWPAVLQALIYPYYGLLEKKRKSSNSVDGSGWFAALLLRNRNDLNDAIAIGMGVGNEDFSKPPVVWKIEPDGTWYIKQKPFFIIDDYLPDTVGLVRAKGYFPVSEKLSKDIQALCRKCKNPWAAEPQDGLPVVEAANAALVRHLVSLRDLNVCVRLNKDELPQAMQSPFGMMPYCSSRAKGRVRNLEEWKPIAVFTDTGALHAIADKTDNFWDWSTKQKMTGLPYVLPGFVAIYKLRDADQFEIAGSPTQAETLSTVPGGRMDSPVYDDEECHGAIQPTMSASSRQPVPPHVRRNKSLVTRTSQSFHPYPAPVSVGSTIIETRHGSNTSAFLDDCAAVYQCRSGQSPVWNDVVEYFTVDPNEQYECPPVVHNMSYGGLPGAPPSLYDRPAY